MKKEYKVVTPQNNDILASFSEREWAEEWRDKYSATSEIIEYDVVGSEKAMSIVRWNMAKNMSLEEFMEWTLGTSIRDLGSELQLSDDEHNKLMRYLYPVDNSKRFKR